MHRSTIGAGGLLFSWPLGLENNFYMQIGLIMIIRLLSKTAILLTEYAGRRRSEGVTVGTLASLFPVPSLSIIFQYIQERVKHN